MTSSGSISIGINVARKEDETKPKGKRMSGIAKGMLAGIAVGAGLMYVFDPRMGNRRLALGRDKIISIAKRSGRLAEAISEDLANRAYGVYAVASRLTGRRLSHAESRIQRTA